MANTDLKKTDEDILIHIDFPKPKDMPTASQFDIQGWIVSHIPIEQIEMVYADDATYQLELIQREDVEKAYPHYPYVRGFIGNVSQSALRHSALLLRYYVNSEAKEYYHLFKNAYPLTEEQKRNKIEKVLSVLACPHCYQDMSSYNLPLPTISSCKNCGSEFGFSDNRFNFLSDELKKKFKVIDTENVSANTYDETAISLIKSSLGKLVLDCGAGKRNFDYPNVINFEIVPYDSTDVLGVGEKLPFKDNAFDTVFSFAVLEHVSNPFTCAAELVRVLKPGGTLYCVVPFLQPLHGYPNHFYNMSAQGLINLFEKELQIIESSVPRSGLPIFTLTWFLQRWVAGLDDKAQEDFLEMKVRDLIGNPISYFNQPFIEKLTEDINFELASTTMILAKKPT